jgi:hypothetical protein
MNEKFEKWLDEQLEKTVDSGKVEFDAGRWKQKYPDAYKILVSRGAKHTEVQRFSWGRRLIRIAAIIAVVVLVVFWMPRQPDKHVEPQIKIGAGQSPAAMLSRLSLMRAYERGGLDAVDEQSERAFKLLGKKNTNVSISDLLSENGKQPERKDL